MMDDIMKTVLSDMVKGKKSKKDDESESMEVKEHKPALVIQIHIAGKNKGKK